MQTKLTIPGLALLLLAAPAHAQVVEATAAPPPPAVGIGAKVGVLLPQVATELGTTVTGGLELSFGLPFAARRVALYAEAAYAQPEVSRSGVADPRVAGGSYQGTQTQRELAVGGGLLARVLPPGSTWNGYAQLGVRAYFLETVTNGSAAGAAFGENTEQSTHVGGVGALGGERRAGPGVVLLEVAYGTSDLPHLITGDVTTGAIAIQLGYRLLF